MLYCKAMTNTMTTSLNLLFDDTSEAVDATLYGQIIGLVLIYLTNTRPDICFIVNTLRQYMVNPKHIHLIGVKHVMRYLKGTLDYGFRYTSDSEINLHGFIDSNWAGNTKTKREPQVDVLVWDQA